MTNAICYNTSPEEYFKYFCKDKIAIEKYERAVEDVLHYQEEADNALCQLDRSEEVVYKYERLLDEINTLNVRGSLNMKNIVKAIEKVGIEL
tara:strand:- start:714 stop:989 length:276 start_codon:yes stop_codon:yes gene_type:complete